MTFSWQRASSLPAGYRTLSSLLTPSIDPFLPIPFGQFVSQCSPDNSSAQLSSCSRCAATLRRYIPRIKPLTNPQHVRRYASEAPKSGSNNSVLYTGVGAAGLAGAYLYMRGGDSPSGQQGAAPPSAEEGKIPAATGEVKKAFTGGDQGFLSLVLEKSEIVNHNTKKLTFKLPEEDQESGLPVACTSPRCPVHVPH